MLISHKKINLQLQVHGGPFKNHSNRSPKSTNPLGVLTTAVQRLRPSITLCIPAAFTFQRVADPGRGKPE